MWIRPGSEVVYRPRRRTVSAPDDFTVRVSRHDLGGGVGTSRARTIASYASEDSDAIAALSKRNDRDFLHGVAAKMASLTSPSTYNQPARNYHSSLPPTYRKPAPSAPSTTTNANYFRRAAVLTPEDNMEIASYLQRTPWSATTAGYRRSASVPPIGLSGSVRPSVPKWYPSSAAYYGRSAARTPGGVASWTSGPGYHSGLPVGLPPRPPTGERIDAINDSVVGVAHTALYGDIVIGIPYKKRFMYSIQRELDDMDTQPTSAGRGIQQWRVGSVPPSTHFVKARPGSIAVPNGPPTVNLTKPYSRASYAGPGSYTIRSQPAIYRAPLDASDLDDVISTKSYPGAVLRGRSSASSSRYPRIGVSTYQTDAIENDVDFDNSDAVNQLTALKRDARSMLSRYSLPPAAPTNGPRAFTASELDQKYGQILSSLQSQQRVRPLSEYNYSTSTIPGAERKARRPEVSETRRKLRELLCRSRNDPHYFDN